MPHERLTRQQSQARTRDRLLDAAAEVFAESGVAGASVEQIAERAGYTRGAFYGHFAHKDALVAALLERRTRRERVEVAALADGDTDTWEALRAWHRDRAVHIEEWLALRLELVRHDLRRPAGQRSVLADREVLAREALTGAVTAELGGAGVDDSGASADPGGAAVEGHAEFVALVLHALEDGLAIQRAIDPAVVPPDAVVTATELVLRGARSRRE